MSFIRDKRYLFFERPHFADYNIVSFILYVTLFFLFIEIIDWSLIRSCIPQMWIVKYKKIQHKKHKKSQNYKCLYFIWFYKNYMWVSDMHACTSLFYLFHVPFFFYPLSFIRSRWFFDIFLLTLNVKLSILSSSPSQICMRNFYKIGNQHREMTWTPLFFCDTFGFHFLTMNLFFFRLCIIIFFSTISIYLLYKLTLIINVNAFKNPAKFWIHVLHNFT